MSAQRSQRMAREVIEPPRDGEFFFLEDGKVEERLAGAMERRFLDHFGAVVGRHPVLFLCGAVALGVAATSAVFKI